ncbi:MAG: hypothetical protein ABR968_03065 [Bacteroidales bacterium]|jgi:hypothetical protein
MSRKEKENQLYDEDKVIRIVKNLITHRNSNLIVKYLEAYDKVVILYKEDQIELHQDNKSITYLDITVSLKKREFKELYRLFMDEVKKRREAKTLEKFHKLELLLVDSPQNPKVDKPEHPLVDKPEQPLDGRA